MKSKKTQTGAGSTSPASAGSVWRTDLPDDEMTVLVRLRDADWPVVVGFHEEGRWHDSGADEIADKDVIGWMDLHAAAAILDTPNNRVSGPQTAQETL
jgi:hypothetical protein